MRGHTLLSHGLRFIALCVFALLLLGAPMASAGALDDARAAGLLSDGPDGYLHLASDDVPADTQALMKSINSKRRAKYQEIATKRGLSLDEVAARAGAKLTEK